MIVWILQGPLMIVQFLLLGVTLNIIYVKITLADIHINWSFSSLCFLNFCGLYMFWCNFLVIFAWRHHSHLYWFCRVISALHFYSKLMWIFRRETRKTRLLIVHHEPGAALLQDSETRSHSSLELLHLKAVLLGVWMDFLLSLEGQVSVLFLFYWFHGAGFTGI